MKTLIKLLTLVVIFLTANLAISAPVSVEKAKTVAFNFIKNVDSQISSLDLVYTRHDAFYVFGSQSAWVIVSAQDAVTPILAYSTENSFIIPENDADTTVGNNFWGWINVIEKQIRFVAENNISATEEIENQWISMSAGNNKSPTTVVPPLLTTTWGQGWPYNAYCPDAAGGPGGKAWAGCVATAMAQILHYNYSNQTSFQGVGSYSYQRAGWPVTEANFGATTYNMAIMPNEVVNISDPGASEIATLTYHAAVGCKSIWGAASTGVMFSTNGGSYVLGDYPFLALVQNYLPMAASSRFVIKSQYTDAEWHSLIQAELTNNRPVYYRGDGSLSHAWVCDGVDASNMYHFNWGWDGQYNGYFALSNLNPGGNNLTNNQMAMIGLAPNDGSTLTTNTTWSGTMNVNSINVPDAVTLSIAAGTTISFSPNSSMRVWGRILSNGTQANMVKLTASNQTDGWGGIDFHEDYLDRMADNDTSKFIYTQIEYSKSSGLYIYDYGKVVVDYCKINDNLGYDGGGVFAHLKSVKISNSEVNNNQAISSGGGLYFGFTDNVAVNVCNNDIHSNSAVEGGGFYLYALDNMSFENNIIRLNWAGNGAGGSLGGGSPSLVNNKFVNNIASSFGGGLYMENCSAKIVNNLITNCDALSGAALGIWNGSTPLVLNNTISKNFTQIVSSIVLTSNSVPSFKNTIMYGNFNGNGKEFYLGDNGCDPIIDHCNLEGGINSLGGPGAGGNYSSSNYTNNIDSNPLFVSPSAGAGNGYNGLTADWSLQATSPCVNAGDTTGVSQYLPSLDLAGNPRIVSIIDMGGYEYGCQVPAQPSSITGSTNPCQTSSQVYSVTNVAGVSYAWTVPSGSSITAGQGSSSITVTIGANSGNISVIPSNGCGNGTARSLAITVNTVPAQPSVITGNISPCQGSSQVYSVTNVTGVTYTWAVPTGSTITAGQGTNSITVTIGPSSGNISVTPSNACGNGTSSTLAITVNTVPAQPSAITGNANPCQASSQTYSVTNVAGVSYAWTVPSGSSITAGQGSSSITVTIGANSGNISVVPSNACGNGTARTLAITSNYVTANAGADQTINYGQATQLNGTVTGTGTISILWTANNSSWTSTLEDPITDNLTMTTQFTIAVSNQYGCTADDDMIVNVTGGALAVIVDANPDQICEGESSQLSALASGGTGTYTYSWTSNPAGFTSDEPNPVVSPSQTTVYTVVVNDGNTTVSDDVQVTVNQVPAQPSTIIGESNPCQGSSQVYSVTNVAGVSYTWTVPSGSVIITGQGTSSISVTIGANSGNISVVPSNACGNGSDRTLAITVSTSPAQANQPTGPDTVDLYYTTTSQYTTQEVVNADHYNWILEPSNMGTISGNGSEISINWSGVLGQANLSVQAVNTCGVGQISESFVIQVDNSVGIESIPTPEISIYPNPCDGQFTITSEKPISAVFLYDVSGRVIYLNPPQLPLYQGGLSLEMDCNLPRGMYFVHVYMDKQSIVQKVIIK